MPLINNHLHLYYFIKFLNIRFDTTSVIYIFRHHDNPIITKYRQGHLRYNHRQTMDFNMYDLHLDHHLDISKTEMFTKKHLNKNRHNNLLIHMRTILDNR